VRGLEGILGIECPFLPGPLVLGGGLAELPGSLPGGCRDGLAEKRSVVTARRKTGARAGSDVRRQAWEWATANRAADGSLPSGKVIADRYGRHERWGRLVKSAGTDGEFTQAGSS
jgi:hypothetical protein